MHLIAGFLVASSISYAAFRARSLSRDGALAAAALGTVIFWLGGWQWAVLMLTFFVGSSLLSLFFPGQRSILAEKYSKGSRRDAAQVLGNGGITAVFAVLHALAPFSAWPWLAYSGALAAVNADTWATELSLLSRGSPRPITRLWQTVEAGTSGAISPIGTLAALTGAAAVAFIAAITAETRSLPLFWPAMLGGFLGSLFDSLLGATVQVIYVCSRDGRETEQHPLHRCGAPTFHQRGWAWLNNDWVNVGCGAFGAAAACLIVFASVPR